MRFSKTSKLYKALQLTALCWVMVMVLMAVLYFTGHIMSPAQRVVDGYLSSLQKGNPVMQTVSEQDNILYGYGQVEDSFLSEEFAKEYKQALFEDWTFVDAWKSEGLTNLLIELTTLPSTYFNTSRVQERLYEPLNQIAYQDQNSADLKAQMAEKATQILTDELHAVLEQDLREQMMLRFVVEEGSGTIVSVSVYQDEQQAEVQQEAEA